MNQIKYLGVLKIKYMWTYYVYIPNNNPRWCVGNNKRTKGDRIVRELKIIYLNM